MTPIGGELELAKNDYEVYFTDSGRSSLRLFLRSADHKDKKYLLPDFLCDVIEEVFKKEDIDYEFYEITPSLKIDTKTLKNKQFDALYIINYFGLNHDLSNVNLQDKILIEDNVFFHAFDNSHNANKWFAFNSFRKSSNLADGSHIKTNILLDSTLITCEEAPFSALKYKAKDIKYRFKNYHEQSEELYLKKFEKAESMLDIQNEIYHMSSRSFNEIIQNDINRSQALRKQRFERLLNIFGKKCINPHPSFYSYFIISIDKRDTFQEMLSKEQIYLPVHWKTLNNILHKSILSIPLFETYKDEEFERLVNALRSSYEKL
jgi:hypothetical protein